MSRAPTSFGRPKPRLKPQPKILAICEDTKSGKKYLDDASFYFRVELLVEITHCGRTDPQGIVSEAFARQSKFDHVYCVIDRDGHQKFDEALALARQSKKITVIPSYPCFEFWLLLHFGYVRKPYTAVGKLSAADRLINDLRSCPGMENYAKDDKKNIFEKLLGDRFNTARQVSPRVLAEAITTNEMNPSTTMHELINYLEQLSKPQLA